MQVRVRDRLRNGVEQVGGRTGAVWSRFSSAEGTTRTAVVGSSTALVLLVGIGAQSLLVGPPAAAAPRADAAAPVEEVVTSPVAEVSTRERSFLRGLRDRRIDPAALPAATEAAAHPVAAAPAPLLLPGPTGTLGIPVVAITAYQAAADQLAASDPGCHLPWTLVAGIGRIESGHARGGWVDATGRTGAPILGPVLDGTAGNAAIRDTDGGRLDGDTTWDHAVGPMQFIPSTWARWPSDGNGDGTADPSNIHDAALAAGRYLCASGGDLSTPTGAGAAVLTYNHSSSYVTEVLAWAAAYATGVLPQEVATVAPAVPAAPAVPIVPTTTAAPVVAAAPVPATVPAPAPGPAPVIPGPVTPTRIDPAPIRPAPVTPAPVGPVPPRPAPVTTTVTTAGPAPTLTPSPVPAPGTSTAPGAPTPVAGG